MIILKMEKAFWWIVVTVLMAWTLIRCIVEGAKAGARMWDRELLRKERLCNLKSR